MRFSQGQTVWVTDPVRQATIWKSEVENGKLRWHVSSAGSMYYIVDDDKVFATEEEALTLFNGRVSVELLNIARGTADRLREENDKLRKALVGVVEWSVNHRDAIDRAREALNPSPHTLSRCEPPPEHRDKRWHWLAYELESGYTAMKWTQWGWLWGALHSDGFFMKQAGWRYIAPCEEPKT